MWVHRKYVPWKANELIYGCLSVQQGMILRNGPPTRLQPSRLNRDLEEGSPRPLAANSTNALSI